MAIVTTSGDRNLDELITSAFIPAARQAAAQIERITAALTTAPAMQMATQAERITAALTTAPAIAELFEYATAIAQHAYDAALAENDHDELDTYDLSVLLDPTSRPYIQLAVAALVFMTVFAFVVDNFDLASEAGVLTGSSPLVAAQFAWILTEKLMKRIAHES